MSISRRYLLQTLPAGIVFATLRPAGAASRTEALHLPLGYASPFQCSQNSVVVSASEVSPAPPSQLSAEVQVSLESYLNDDVYHCHAIDIALYNHVLIDNDTTLSCLLWQYKHVNGGQCSAGSRFKIPLDAGQWVMSLQVSIQKRSWSFQRQWQNRVNFSLNGKSPGNPLRSGTYFVPLLATDGSRPDWAFIRYKSDPHQGELTDFHARPVKFSYLELKVAGSASTA